MKNKKWKQAVSKTLVIAWLLSFVLGFAAGIVIDDSLAAGKKKTTVSKQVSSDCSSVKLRYYQAVSLGRTPSKNDLTLSQGCATKEKKLWNKNPSSAQCRVIKLYEDRRKLTAMVKKKKMNWTDYFYCKAKLAGFTSSL